MRCAGRRVLIPGRRYLRGFAGPSSRPTQTKALLGRDEIYAILYTSSNSENFHPALRDWIVRTSTTRSVADFSVVVHSLSLLLCNTLRDLTTGLDVARDCHLLSRSCEICQPKETGVRELCRLHEAAVEIRLRPARSFNCSLCLRFASPP